MAKDQSPIPAPEGGPAGPTSAELLNNEGILGGLALVGWKPRNCVCQVAAPGTDFILALPSRLRKVQVCSPQFPLQPVLLVLQPSYSLGE